MVPDVGVAGLIECQTDSKARTMQNVRDTLKHHGGTMTPTAYMFDRRGKIVFKKEEGKTWDEGSILDKTIESGAEDVEVEDGEVTILTQPNEMAAVAEMLSGQLDSKPESQELVWIPKRDAMIDLAEGSQQKLQKIIDGLEDEPTVQEVYLNTQ